MREQIPITPADRELEQALLSLQPAPAAINRDRLLFEAGKAQGRRQALLWRALAAALCLVLVTTLTLHPVKPTPDSPGIAKLPQPPSQVAALTIRQVPQQIEYYDPQQRTAFRVTVPMEIVSAQVP